MPIDAMHGSLCAKQLLQYGENQVPGWNAQDGRTAVVGYKPNIIAAQKRRTRVRYYMVRVKSTVNWTNGTRLSAAAFGGAGAIYQAVRSDATLLALVENVRVLQAPKKTLRAFLFPLLVETLRNKDASLVVTAGSTSATIDNPWRCAGTPNVTIQSDIINKFNSYLS
jgi:hypothetical protein